MLLVKDLIFLHDSAYIAQSMVILGLIRRIYILLRGNSIHGSIISNIIRNFVILLLEVVRKVIIPCSQASKFMTFEFFLRGKHLECPKISTEHPVMVVMLLHHHL